MTGPRRKPVLALALALALAAALVAECAGATGTSSPSAGPSETDDPAYAPLTGTVTVLAAASLTEPFQALAADYEQHHPGVTVRLSFGSSTTLAQQISAGAPADLYASAGTSALTQLPEPLRDAPHPILARNTLAIATAPGNPHDITGLSSLSDPALAVVLCAATAPCGSAADEVLTRAGVPAHVVSRELDAKATLAKVRLLEADAAIVYRSDVVSAGSTVTGVEIPASDNTTVSYPLVTVTPSPLAADFAAFLQGPEGAAALAREGFVLP